MHQRGVTVRIHCSTDRSMSEQLWKMERKKLSLELIVTQRVMSEDNDQERVGQAWECESGNGNDYPTGSGDSFQSTAVMCERAHTSELCV